MLGTNQVAGIIVEGGDEAQDVANHVQEGRRRATSGQVAHGGERRGTRDRTHEQDGTASQFSQAVQFGQIVAVVGRREGFLGVDDEEHGIELADGTAEQVEIVGDGEGAVDDVGAGAIKILDGGQQGDLGGIGTGSQQAGGDGGKGVIAGDEEHAPMRTRRVVGEGQAT